MKWFTNSLSTPHKVDKNDDDMSQDILENDDDLDEESESEYASVISPSLPHQQFQLSPKRPRCKTWCARTTSPDRLLFADSRNGTTMLIRPDEDKPNKTRPRFLSWGIPLSTPSLRIDTDTPDNDDDVDHHDSLLFCDEPSLDDSNDHQQQRTLYWDVESQSSQHSHINEEKNTMVHHHQHPVPMAPLEGRHMRVPSVTRLHLHHNTGYDPTTVDEAGLFSSSSEQQQQQQQHTYHDYCNHAPSILSDRSILFPKIISKSRDRNCTTYCFSVLVGVVVLTVFAIYVVMALFLL